MGFGEAYERTVEMNPEYEKKFSQPVPKGDIILEDKNAYNKLKNGLQIILALRHVPMIPIDADEKNAVFDDWIERHAVKFGEVFQEMINEDPHHFDEFATFRDISEAELSLLERRLGE